MPDNLQFDRAEPAPGSTTPCAMTCKSCGSQLTDSYFTINGNIICERCRRTIEAEWDRGGAAGRLGKALGLGILAMIACSIVWYVVLAATDSQWGILAVVVGFVVGGAVRKGSNGRGGWRYQALAIFLTYTAIVSSYVPYMIKGAREQSSQIGTVSTTSADSSSVVTASATEHKPATTTKSARPGGLTIAVAILFGIGMLYALPFLMGFQNLIGLLIIGFALYEAWKLNRRTELQISGPHKVAMQSAAI